MIEAIHLRDEVITPTLKHLGLWSPAAVNLLLGTAAQESHLGTYLRQIRGPAMGIYQVEPFTHDDVFDNFLMYRPELQDKVTALAAPVPEPIDQLVGNLAYATAIARIIYYRRPERLPAAGDLDGLARYWKLFYNTPKGRGTESEFKSNFDRLVGGAAL